MQSWRFHVKGEAEVRSQRRFTYDDEILLSNLVKDHLADVVFVERGTYGHLGPLIASTHQQVGLI